MKLSVCNFSRCFNHNEHGNLAVSLQEGRLAFHAAEPVAEGDELTFDYGLDYWVNRADPMPGTDSRRLQLGLKRLNGGITRLSSTVSNTGVLGVLLLPVLIPLVTSSLPTNN